MQFTVHDSITPFHAQLFDGGGEPVPLALSFVNLAADIDNNGVADAAANVRNLGLFETSESFGRVTPMLGKAEQGTVTTHDEDVDADIRPLSYCSATGTAAARSDGAVEHLQFRCRRTRSTFTWFSTRSSRSTRFSFRTKTRTAFRTTRLVTG